MVPKEAYSYQLAEASKAGQAHRAAVQVDATSPSKTAVYWYAIRGEQLQQLEAIFIGNEGLLFERNPAYNSY